jgi:dGTPase
MRELQLELSKEIIMNNGRRERKTLSKYACKSFRGRRYGGEEIPDRHNIRPSFFHDTDGIIHSRAYTRYIDKTQVFYLFDNDHITHRVLHVQLVSKIGRTIGRFLRLNEDLIEAISLGHDLGHVPYGHNGERYLNEICQKRGIGYFIHNAQSVRALMELENGGKGLNLTLQVLDGILCHNGEYLNQAYEPDKNKDWDKFMDEYTKCWQIKNYDKQIRPMTLEGCLMRISDVIAYIGRDIEDAIVVGLIKREDIPDEVTKVLGNNNRQIINTLIIDLLNNSYDKNYLTFSDDVFKALDTLFDFNYEHIYRNPQKATQDGKIENMFHYLFDVYLDDIEKKKKSSSIYKYFLDEKDEDYKTKNCNERIIIDFIAGMTDDFFNNEFKERMIPIKFGMTI